MEDNKTTEVDPQLTPSEYFDKLKDAKQTITEEKLRNSYDVILRLADKYNRTEQKRSLSKLQFLTQVLCEEEKLLPLGVTTFVYRDVIEDYIDNITDDVVKIIELSNYMREVPDEIVEVVEKTKGIFDEFYVVFTDYTGHEERRVAQQRRDKDPILFGCFKKGAFVADRFYFLGDWVDEHCDLTLDKLVDTYRQKKNNLVPIHDVELPQTPEELLAIISAYQPKSTDSDVTAKQTFYMASMESSSAISNYVKDSEGKPKKSFFDKVKTIFPSHK